jgi:hypothetical protein
MDNVGVKDTAAYRIVRQITDHTWGDEEKYSDKEFISVYRAFRRSGGSWYDLMAGHMAHITILENAIDAFMNKRHKTTSD